MISPRLIRSSYGPLNMYRINSAAIPQSVHRWATGRTAWVTFPAAAKILLLFSTVSWECLGLTQPPSLSIALARSPGVSQLVGETDRSTSPQCRSYE